MVLICKTLSPLHPRMLYAKFFEFLDFVNVVLLFRNYFPLFFRLAQSFFRGRFLNFVNVFSLFCYYLPLENGVVLYLSKLESP